MAENTGLEQPSNQSIPSNPERYRDIMGLLKIPYNIQQAIEASSDLDRSQEPEKKEYSLGANWEPVRTMVESDVVLGMSRSTYELVQGQDDFGWLNQDSPTWQPPRVDIALGADTRKWDGNPEVIRDIDSMSFINHGVLPLVNVTHLGSSSTAYFEAGGEGRKGGYGQGMKISFLEFVSTPEDRANLLRLLKDDLTVRTSKFRFDSDYGLNKARLQLISAHLESSEVEGESSNTEANNYVTVQARDNDGTYYRAYVYRVPLHIDGRDLWSAAVVVTKLDEAKIPDNQKNMIIITVHNPDAELREVLADGTRNNLNLNPMYPGEQSLVRDEDSSAQSYSIRRRDQDQLDIKHLTNKGNITLERIAIEEGEEPGIFFRGTRMDPERRVSLVGPWSWNIQTNDPRTEEDIHRTNNSRYVTGDIAPLIAEFTAQASSVEDWKILLSKLVVDENEEWWNKGDDSLPAELSFYRASSKRIGSSYRSDTTTSEALKRTKRHLREAFDELWPKAGGKYASSPETLALQMLLDTSSVEGVQGVPFIDRRLGLFLSENGVSSVDEELHKLLQEHTNLTIKAFLLTDHIKVFPDELFERHRSQDHQPQSPDQVASTIFDTMFSSDRFDFRRLGWSYTLSNDGAVEFILNGGDNKNQHHRLREACSVPYRFNFKSDDDIIFFSEENHPAISKYLLPQLLKLASIGVDVEVFSGNASPKIVITMINGKAVIVKGDSSRDRKLKIDQLGVRFKLPRVTQAGDILERLDALTEKVDPVFVERREQTDLMHELDEMSRKIQESQTKVEELEDIIRKRHRSIQELKMATQGIIEWGEDSVHERAAHISDIGFLDEDAQVPIGGQKKFQRVFFGMRPGGTLLETGLSKAVRSKLMEEGSRERKVGTSRNHFRASWYNERDIPNNHNLGASTHFHITNEGIRTTTEHTVQTYIGGNGRNSIWRSYTPDKYNPQYIERNSSGDDERYVGIIETDMDMHIGHQRQVVLPIDASKFDIAYIQIPVTSGTPRPPLVFEDELNNEFIIQTHGSDVEGAIKVLPKGTRFYLKRKPKSGTSDLDYIRETNPAYIKDVTTPIANIDRLDPELQKMIKMLKKSDATPEQIAETARIFWTEKRARYNPDSNISGMEDLLITGDGVCRYHAVGLCEILRLCGIPARVRTTYPDFRGQGTMSPPLHLIVEYIGSSGDWSQLEGTSPYLAPKIADMQDKLLAKDNAPTILDGQSLLMALQAQKSGTRYIPEEFKEFLKNANIADSALASSPLITASVLRSQGDLTPQARLNLVQSLALEFTRQSSQKESKPTNEEMELSRSITEAIVLEYVRLQSQLRQALTVSPNKDKIIKLQRTASESFALAIQDALGLKEPEIEIKQVELQGLDSRDRRARAISALRKITDTTNTLHILHMLEHANGTTELMYRAIEELAQNGEIDVTNQRINQKVREIIEREQSIRPNTAEISLALNR